MNFDDGREMGNGMGRDVMVLLLDLTEVVKHEEEITILLSDMLTYDEVVAEPLNPKLAYLLGRKQVVMALTRFLSAETGHTVPPEMSELESELESEFLKLFNPNTLTPTSDVPATLDA